MERGYNQNIADTLGAAGNIISIVDLEELRAHVRAVQKGNADHDSFAPIFDPSSWLDARKSGLRQSADVQEKIAQKMLEIRELLDQLPQVRR